MMRMIDVNDEDVSDEDDFCDGLLEIMMSICFHQLSVSVLRSLFSALCKEGIDYIQLPRIRHSVRPSVRPSVLVRHKNDGPPPFLMPCCIGCSVINKINRHLICHCSPHLGKNLEKRPLTKTAVTL